MHLKNAMKSICETNDDCERVNLIKNLFYTDFTVYAMKNNFLISIDALEFWEAPYSNGLGGTISIIKSTQIMFHERLFGEVHSATDENRGDNKCISKTEVAAEYETLLAHGTRNGIKMITESSRVSILPGVATRRLFPC